MNTAEKPLIAPEIYTPSGFTQKALVGVRALDVGCGGRKLPGAVGIDRLNLQGVDVVHDLSVFPWPLEESSFDVVLVNHYLEHAADALATLEEIHRVLAPGGRVIIQVPFFRVLDAVVDPTHVRFFASQTLDYVIAGTTLSKYQYTPFQFIQRGFWYAWPQRSRNPLARLFKAYIHAHPHFYDQYLSLLFPVKCLTWELEKQSA